ncbi:L,D-transpeptidase [Leptolyngbya sp. FACHB-17]|uniref:L,D-transpeptidase n=1 Tax=unclassified Leptolyngbya TaxID=2650499 RepID=UPI001680F773|nr:L,D-transpeptidase [Leptolyngbya sp. FACHB-17]MBD2081222.1 L,D-transpeptidase [Leptolyngbya sp. FACHB-17]
MATKVQNSSLARALTTICVLTGCAIALLQLQRLPAISMPQIELPNFQVSVTPTPEPSPVIERELVVDLSDRKVRLYEQKKLEATYSIAIGQEGWETPTGTFKVQQMYENPAWQHPITGEKIAPGHKDNPLGQRWIGFTSQGKLLIGFHGTTDYSLLGQAVSHGCLRMRNADVVALYKQVQIGTLVVVKP